MIARALVFLLACGAGAAGLWTYRAGQLGAEDRLALARPPSAAARWATVSVSGEARQLSPDGEWVPLAADTSLEDGHQIRTEGGGAIELRSSGGSEVKLSPQTHVSFRRSGEVGARLRCVQGHIVVRSTTPVEIELRTGDAVVGGRGAFTILCGRERTYLTGGEGSVAVTVDGRRTPLEPGALFCLDGSGGSVRREKLGDALVLEVAPARRENEVALVSGRVGAAARVFVGPVIAAVDKDGAFSARVPLTATASTLTVLATDITGREKEVAVLAPAARARPPAMARPGPKPGAGAPKTKQGFKWGVKR